MMRRGGRREGSGRKLGAATAKTREIADKAASEGLTPLEYMIQVFRDPTQSATRRDDMAKAAAPFLHPRLSSVATQHSGLDGKPMAVTMTVEFVSPKREDTT